MWQRSNLLHSCVCDQARLHANASAIGTVTMRALAVRLCCTCTVPSLGASHGSALLRVLVAGASQAVQLCREALQLDPRDPATFEDRPMEKRKSRQTEAFLCALAAVSWQHPCTGAVTSSADDHDMPGCCFCCFVQHAEMQAQSCKACQRR